MKPRKTTATKRRSKRAVHAPATADEFLNESEFGNDHTLHALIAMEAYF